MLAAVAVVGLAACGDSKPPAPSQFRVGGTAVPSSLSGVRVVSDIDGVIFVFPSTIDPQSPAFLRTAVACKFSLHNH